MKDIKVIDNFLDEKDFGRIKSMLNGSLFPWYYSPTVVAQNKDNQFQFCHMFYQWWSAIFFINTNNGKTLFKNIDKEIISKENRIVIFDGRLEHTGTTCTDQRNRILINFNYFNKELDNDI